MNILKTKICKRLICRIYTKCYLAHRLAMGSFPEIYRQVSNITRTLIGNKIVDNSDVVGASPFGAAPTTSSLST